MAVTIGSHEDLPDGAEVTLREPGHPARVDVQFAEPPDARQGTPEGVVNRGGVVLVAGIMGGLVGGRAARPGNREYDIGAVVRSRARTEEAHASFEPVGALDTRLVVRRQGAGGVRRVRGLGRSCLGHMLTKACSRTGA